MTDTNGGQVEVKSFLVRAKNHFGLKQGQDLKGFGEELKLLTPQDKLDLIDGFEKMGEPVDPKDIERFKKEAAAVAA